MNETLANWFQTNSGHAYLFSICKYECIVLISLLLYKMPHKFNWEEMSQDNPGITHPSNESQGITSVVLYILAYSVYIQYICYLHPDI